MFRHIAAFEWRHHARSPVFWLGCVLFFLLAFASTTIEQVQIGDAGYVHKNSPFAILQTMAIMGLFATFVTVAMVANAVVRDDETGFAPIIRSTSIGKGSYLGGRFLGATGAALVVLATVPLGIWVGSCMPWVDPEKIGPSRAVDYLYALFVFALPTLLITGAVFFALATATRSMMWSYVGAVAFMVLDLVGGIALRDPAYDPVTALLDPFGVSALDLVTKYWTAFDRNTRLPPLTGWLLANRLLWGSVAVVVFAVAYRVFHFSFDADAGRRVDVQPVRLRVMSGTIGRSRMARAAGAHRAELAALSEANPGAVRGVVEADARRGPIVLPDIPPRTRATARRQWLALARLDTAFVFRSPAFFVLLLLGLLNAMSAMFLGDDIYGSPSYPVTRLMVTTLESSFGIFTVLIAGFYAGELVWRDRERRLHEIVDAAPVPDWAHVAPKILAVTGVLLASLLMGVMGGILVQLIRGYLHFQVGAYLLWFVWPWLVRSLLIAVLAVFVQVVVPHKAIGWAVMLLYLVAMFAMPNIGFEHHLYLYGTTSRVPLSDMDGMGRFWIGRAWFELYWMAFAALLVLLSYALWRHGETVALRPRLKQLRHRLRGPTRAAFGVAAVTWIASGAWIYYNTNVLNHYASQRDRDAMLADYERALLKYERVPQPRVADVTLDVQLYPREARAEATGRYTLVNRTQAPIDRIYLQWWERLRLDSVTLEGATVDQDWPRFHYRIYRLARALQPGETRTLGFTSTLEERGFPNDRPLTQIVENGTFIDNWKLSPSLGFSRDVLLQERSRRRSQGLPSELRMPKLEDESANAANALSVDSDWVAADISVTTDADQTPVAPGRAVSDTTTTQDGRARRTVHFRSDAPINQYFSIQSARYDVRRSIWAGGTGGVDLAVYFHPPHEFNVTRMLDGMRLALALYSEKFSPYQFEQMRIIEFPYLRFAESFANTVPYSERIGFVQDWSDPRKIDIATYVTAHEVAHQWWAHQLVPAGKQGAGLLTESFAQYSALLAMERLYGPDAARRFLKYELDSYLAARGSEPLEELPLERVEEQRYIYYSKGSLAMYWAKEVLGEETIDRALRKLLAAHAFKGAPYADAREFIALLRAEVRPDQQALITDLFERITLYDLKATNAHAARRADGRYDLSFDVESHKFYADGFGKQDEAPMDEPVELGAFTDKPGEKDFKASDRLWLEKRPVRSGVMHVALVLDKPPKWVGVDPYNKRIDRNSDDNLVQVEAVR